MTDYTTKSAVFDSVSDRFIARPVAWLVLLVAAMLLLPGCVSAQPGDQQIDDQVEIQLLDYKAALEEYRQAAAALTLPAGATFPEDPLGAQDEAYQEGFGTGRAVFYWNCAWGSEWLAVRDSDPEAAQTALDIYESVQETDTFQQNWDKVSIQDPFIKAVEAARLGDPTLVQDDIALNCP